MLEGLCYVMDLKGAYVCMPFETINEIDTASTQLCARYCRTFLRINVYLSKGFVLHVPSGYYQGVLKRPQVPLLTQGGTTVIQAWKLYQYPRLQR